METSQADDWNTLRYDSITSGVPNMTVKRESQAVLHEADIPWCV